MEVSKKIGRPKNKVQRVKSSFALMPHTIDTLDKLAEETGRTKSDLIDLALDAYAGQFEYKPKG